MHFAAFGDIYKRALLGCVFTGFCFKINLTLYHIKHLLYVCMGMRARATAGRYKHVNNGIGPFGLFGRNHNTVGITYNRKVFTLVFVYCYYIVYHNKWFLMLIIKYV